jgi:hypothetical protein
MSYHTTVNGNERELKSQNPFYWIGVTPRLAQADARGAARYLLRILGRSAKAYACGLSFAVLPTRVSGVGLRLRHTISAWCPSRCPRRHAGT